MKLGFLTCCTALIALMGVAQAAGAAHRPRSDAARFRSEADVWIMGALQRLEVVPGLAMAVVVEDEIVLARGWGMADLETHLPATDSTLYYIASSTKSFTALAAAILDARGQLDLDSPLADHLDGLRIDPALVPERVRLRDLLTHTSGIANEPITWRLAYTGEHDPKTLWSLLEHCTPAENAPLGTFLYSNSGYNILTVLLDRELKKPWQDVLRDEVFEPIGLSRTTAYASLPRKKGWPVAAPYFGVYPGGLQRSYLEKQDNTMQSAGGLLTTVADLGRWLAFQLNDGKVDGRQLIDAAVVRRTHEALATADDDRPPFGKSAYGLGWAHGTYRGQTILHHSGSFPGFRTLVSFSPDARVGVAVLVNEGSVGDRFADVAAVWAYDWWLGVNQEEARADSLTTQLVTQKHAFAARMAAELEARAKRKWMLSRPLAAYGGTYRNPLHGTLVVTSREDALEVRIGNLHGMATAFERPETARVELEPGSGRVIAFRPETGTVDRVVIGDVTYERVE